jgi:acyl-CoA thioesterase
MWVLFTRSIPLRKQYSFVCFGDLNILETVAQFALHHLCRDSSSTRATVVTFTCLETHDAWTLWTLESKKILYEKKTESAKIITQDLFLILQNLAKTLTLFTSGLQMVQ